MKNTQNTEKLTANMQVCYDATALLLNKSEFSLMDEIMDSWGQGDTAITDVIEEWLREHESELKNYDEAWDAFLDLDESDMRQYLTIDEDGIYPMWGQETENEGCIAFCIPVLIDIQKLKADIFDPL